MEKNQMSQIDRIMRFTKLIEQQTGKAVRPYRTDGYVNLLNRYGTSKDTTEHYKFSPEPAVPDELLSMFYEGNGLFAKIIDTPAEEAVKHGFELENIKDENVATFYREALDELDWDETVMTALKWARLFGGSIAVMLINDGRGLEEPLDWKNIKSIDDIRVYDRSLITPDYQSMYSYDPVDPFKTRGSRLGMPEYYQVSSRYGNFTVHESRCLVFQNGILPEKCTNSVYQLWGMPEYVRIQRAIRDTELAHASGPKMLDRSVQAVYKMKDLAAELATEEGESKVLKRLQTIDMARGLLNSITIDSEGEDYDFRTFQFSGVTEVIDSVCNFLSALTSIPQTILFGRSPAGMDDAGDADFENYYNYVERIRNRMIKSNLRYLLSVIFQAGQYTGEIDDVPKIKIKFNPLWSLSELEEADLEQKKAATQLTKAQTAQVYIDMQVIDPSEVRKKLADTEEFDVENMLDGSDDEGELLEDFINTLDTPTEEGVAKGEGNSPDAAPAATKLPQDMNAEDIEQQEQQNDSADNLGSVGVLVISNGKVLSGTRHNDFGYGLVCGPGGHIEKGETPAQAAFRETEEEFGISPKELIPLGLGPKEPETGLTPHLFLCTEYEGEPNCLDLEMTGAKFRTLEELDQLAASLFQPFADGLEVLRTCIDTALFFGDEEGHEQLVESIGNAMQGDDETAQDGGPGSGNHNHEGIPGKVGGSLPSGKAATDRVKAAYKTGNYTDVGRTFRKELNDCPVGSRINLNGKTYTKTGDDEFSYERSPGRESKWNTNQMVNSVDAFDETKAPKFEDVSSEDVAKVKVISGELKPKETSVKTAEYKGETNDYVAKKTYSERKAQFQSNAGREFSDEEVAEMVDAVTEYTGTDYMNILAAQTGFGGRFAEYSQLLDDDEKRDAIKKADAVEKAIKYSDKFDGTAKRALGFPLDGELDASADYEQFRASLKDGNVIQMGSMTSWTTSDTIVDQLMAHRADIGEETTRTAEVVLSCKSKTGVDIDNMSCMNQSEILFSKDAKFKVKSVKETVDTSGTYDETIKVFVELEEIVDE